MTLPAMSNAPYGDAFDVRLQISALASVIEADLPHRIELLRSDVVRIRVVDRVSPREPPLIRTPAAFSHSASVGSRYFFPVFALSQLQYAVAASQFTPITG